MNLVEVVFAFGSNANKWLGLRTSHLADHCGKLLAVGIPNSVVFLPSTENHAVCLESGLRATFKSHPAGTTIGLKLSE
ncbi:hypothetical protein BpHYR1_012188 [Brachionus plicatilis]|uniref:Uncharacterized protein n=1 Tax=Brachionus plicatilis TaxID=10195 RepID=A0A3M7Q6K1_BRAPC|nr:hypothetical protein BpHYR1_012188 [Brachionus plicatilis]